jgi:hypothetical protein
MMGVIVIGGYGFWRITGQQKPTAERGYGSTFIIHKNSVESMGKTNLQEYVFKEFPPLWYLCFIRHTERCVQERQPSG